MRKCVVTILAVAMVLSCSSLASAVITKIEIIQALPIHTDYLVGTGELTYTVPALASAVVTYDDNSTETFTSVTMSTTVFNLTNDNSSGGVARGEFDTGTFSILLSSKPFFPPPITDVTLIQLEGTVSFFTAVENNDLPNPTLNGEGVINLTVNTVTTGGSGISWGSTNNKSGIRTTSSSLTPGDPTSFGQDLSSNNGVMTIFADASAIPEPATIMLLGLGGLGLIRRRKA